jgi:hypothetical protein
LWCILLIDEVDTYELLPIKELANKFLQKITEKSLVNMPMSACIQTNMLRRKSYKLCRQLNNSDSPNVNLLYERSLHRKEPIWFIIFHNVAWLENFYCTWQYIMYLEEMILFRFNCSHTSVYTIQEIKLTTELMQKSDKLFPPLRGLATNQLS